MAANGTVTITAKVASDDAERKLKALGDANSQVGKHADQARDAYGRFTRESSAGISQLNAQQQAMMVSMAGTTAEMLRQQEAAHEMKRTLIEVGGAVGGVAVAAANAHVPVGLVVTSLKGLGVLGGPVAAVATVAALGFTAVQVAQEMQRLHDVTLSTASAAQAKFLTLEHVTHSLGASFEDATGTINRFRDGITGFDSLSHTVTVLNTMGLSVEKQQKLIGGLRDTLIAMGKDADTGLSEAADSILNVNTRGLKQLGVLQDIDQKFAEYARSVSTTADNLTVLEKQQVIVNTLLERTGKFAGTATTVLDTHQGAVRHLTEDNKRLEESIGKLFLPWDTFKVKVKDQITEWKLWAVESVLALKDSENWIARNLLGMSAYEQAIDTMLPKITELQARNKRTQELAKQARSEGGYGPANTVGTKQFYEDVAKKQAEEREQEKREGEQRAKEQRQQAQQLQDDLALIGKTGRDLELEQERIQHRKQMEIAQGNHRNLELENERHRLAMRAIDAKYPPLVMGGVNTAAPGLSISGAGVGKLKLGSLGLGNWSASGGVSLPSADPGSPGPEMWYASIKEGTENGLFDGVKAAASADFGGLGQAITTIMSKAPDPMIQAMVGPAGLAITFGAMIASSFAQAAERAEQYNRHIEDLASGGKLTKDQQRRREIEDDPERQRLLAERESLRGRAALTNPAGGGKDVIDFLNREADARQKLIDGIDRARQAAWDQADSYERLNKKIQDNLSLQQAKQVWADYAGSAADNLARKQLQLSVLNGTATDSDLAKFDAMLAGKNGREEAILGGMKQLGISDVNGGRAMADEIVARIEGGADLTSKDAFRGTRLFGNNDFDPNSEAGKIIIGLAQNLKGADLDRTIGEQEANRIGHTPDRPLYSSIVNFKDMMAFFAPGELFRAQGPGTRRADGMKDRAVNTRAV